MSDDAKDEAEEDGWLLARYFKLHLHPAELRTSHSIATEGKAHLARLSNEINMCACPYKALPQGVAVETIYSDFLRYVLKNTRAFFETRTPNGATIWQQLIDDADIIIAHPNAWGLREQHVLRRAAIRADCVPVARADSRIRFVSEGEASVHFCIVHGKLATKLKV